jgi:hypothetical protein
MRNNPDARNLDFSADRLNEADSINRNVFELSLHKFTLWLNQYGLKGYDPYDIKSHKWIISISKKSGKSKFYVLLRELIYEFIYSFPVLSRKLLGIKPQINAKAMGLFATSYLELYTISRNQNFFEKSQECIEWLKENKIEINDGIGWGYPFDWQSSQNIPELTPNGIVTTAVGEAFWNHYKFKNNPEYLEYCIKIATFLNSLPTDTYNTNICFSYTPLFINHVHNLNLFVAEFLIKVGKEVGNQEWIDRGNQATSYTISCQRPDGSFDYNGPPEKPQNFVDNYHTGFVLRMLHSIWKLTGRKDVFSAMEKCYNHYKNNFFENGKIPKLMPDRKYRIDIHSASESVNCLSELSIVFPSAMPLAEDILLWTIENLQSKRGYFYYGILKSRIIGIPYKSKIAYIRWGQAWMLKAFSNYLKHQKTNIRINA